MTGDSASTEAITETAEAEGPGAAATLGGFAGRVAEWQTRWLQVPVRATSWGFKSPLAHI